MCSWKLRLLLLQSSELWAQRSTGGTKLRHIIFIMIESGMVLFAVQLVRVVLYNLRPAPSADYAFADNFSTGITQMFNVIIRSVHFYFFVLLITCTWLGQHTNNNFVAGLNEIVLR
jgi:hypothetical protein